MYLKRIDIKNFILTFCFVVGIFCSGSGLSICIENLTIRLLFIANMLLLTYKIVINHGVMKIPSKREIHALLVFLGLILLSLFYNFNISYLSSWMRIILTLSLVGMMIDEMEADLLIYNFVKIMKMIAIISLIGYLLFVVLNWSTSLLPILYKVSNNSVSYYSIGIYNIWISEFGRNCGLFWEPSIFASYLSIALIFTIFFSKDININNAVIFIITILTTQSTGGYILLLLILLMCVWKYKKYNTLLIVLTLIFGILVIIGFESICKFLLNLNYNIFSKIIYFNSMGTSMTRYYSIIINCKIWVENNLIFGVGLADIDKLYLYYRDIIAPKTLAPAQTSTTTLMMAALGIGGIYYLALWLRSVVIQKMELLQKLLFMVCIIFILNQTPHTYFYLTYYLLFSLLKNGLTKNIKRFY